MPISYRRPGVYLEESLLINSADTASTFTVAAFVGAAEKGPFNEPTRVDSWSDYVSLFGGFSPITPPAPATTKVRSYLPFSVYSFYQNGGRSAWIIRAVSQTPSEQGTAASIMVNGGDTGETPLRSFNLKAVSPGIWGNKLKYALSTQSTSGTAPNADNAFSLQVILVNIDNRDEVVETFSGLSIKGEIPGTRTLDSVINDPSAGSQYIRVDQVNPGQGQPVATASPVALAGGVEPKMPDAPALVAAASAVSKVEGPVMVNICGYHNDISQINTANAATTFVGATVPGTNWIDPETGAGRTDIFVINDSAPPRLPQQSSGAYKTTITTYLGANPGDSYSASYTPWILMPNPQAMGEVVAVPPGGAVMGVAARIDSTVGVFRAPAGVIAGVSNAVGIGTKFTDTELGDLNSANINVIRSLPGAGICVMGGRTRKPIGVDRYISARRTLIYIKEVLKRTTQFAVFENNDQRLWSALMMAADRLLRPLWEAGGLKGANTSDAYYIRCDDTLNTPSVIASGEVRMEVGVALQYPAEFVVIRITQFDRGTYSTEVQPIG